MLRKVRGVERVEIAGSLRRRKETIGDIDLLAASRDPQPVLREFANAPDVAQVIASGPTKCSVRLKLGLQADLRVVEPQAFGAALHYFTGSKTHNIAVRWRAVEARAQAERVRHLRPEGQAAGRRGPRRRSSARWGCRGSRRSCARGPWRSRRRRPGASRTSSRRRTSWEISTCTARRPRTATRTWTSSWPRRGGSTAPTSPSRTIRSRARWARRGAPSRARRESPGEAAARGIEVGHPPRRLARPAVAGAGRARLGGREASTPSSGSLGTDDRADGPGDPLRRRRRPRPSQRAAARREGRLQSTSASAGRGGGEAGGRGRG